MRKPKAGTLKRPPVKPGPPTYFPPKPPRKFKGGKRPGSSPFPERPTLTAPKRPGPSPVPKRPKPTGPDYVGPYSIDGTAGPVNETVSKVRDIMKDTPSRPIPYQKKGGSMKKTVKKTVAKKPKQLGPQSFAKGGIKTMVKSKKK